MSQLVKSVRCLICGEVYPSIVECLYKHASVFEKHPDHSIWAEIEYGGTVAQTLREKYPDLKDTQIPSSIGDGPGFIDEETLLIMIKNRKGGWSFNAMLLDIARIVDQGHGKKTLSDCVNPTLRNNDIGGDPRVRRT